MSGGGARAAYQVGVIKALAKIVPKQSANPFPILCGTSAGAINATALACYAHNFREGVVRLEKVWRHFHVDQVYRADLPGVLARVARMFAAMLWGGRGRRLPASLLDNKPLERLLREMMPMHQIQHAIASEDLMALCISATGYSSGESISFFQAAQHVKTWRRNGRIGSATILNVHHLLASAAIPIVFPAVKINREYFGDGAIRQPHPISPALHLGANRILAIGAAKPEEDEAERQQSDSYPSIAQILGQMYNSSFLDSLATDLEFLEKINECLEMIPDQTLQEKQVKIKPVETLVINPSQEINIIASKHAHHIPPTMKFFLGGIGAMKRSGSTVLSYLLFEKPFTSELIDLGYEDAMNRETVIRQFLAD